MPGLNIPTDFFRYLVQKGLARFDDVGVRVSVPPRVVIPIEYAPPDPEEIWLLYYMSFGDVPADVFAVKCHFENLRYAGYVFEHECRPMGYDVIDPGCMFWCPISRDCPFKVTLENLTDTSQTFVARLWQLRIKEEDMPRVVEAFERYIEGRRPELKALIDSIEALKKEIEDLSNILSKLVEILARPQPRADPLIAQTWRPRRVS